MAEFHGTDAVLTEIPANEILDKIRKEEPVEYDHIRVTGDLDIDNLDLSTKHVLIKNIGISEKCKVILSSIKITNSTFNNQVIFSSVLFEDSINFENGIFSGIVIFAGATFNRDVNFSGARFSTFADFSAATFGAVFGGVLTDFRRATFNGIIIFIRARFSEITFFKGAKFNDYADFSGAKFGNYAYFSEAAFTDVTNFRGATFSGIADLGGATFSEIVEFSGTKFEGDGSTFRDATFILAKSQEEACRRAKNVLERNGDREEAGYHFYREMEAKRKQKPWYIRYPEFVAIQGIFGYGVHPWRLIYWWLLFVSIFSNIYLIGHGIDGIDHWYDYIEISFAISIAPGYIAAIINPTSAGYKLLPIYQAVAMIETIVGTFLWAGFIATFARKYMK